MPSDLGSRALLQRADASGSDGTLRVLVGTSVLTCLLLAVCASWAFALNLAGLFAGAVGGLVIAASFRQVIGRVRSGP